MPLCYRNNSIGYTNCRNVTADVQSAVAELRQLVGEGSTAQQIAEVLVRGALAAGSRSSCIHRSSGFGILSPPRNRCKAMKKLCPGVVVSKTYVK
jgi:hypothetical protein